MDRNREAFRDRFQRWKKGEKVYDNGRPAAIQEVDKSDADFAKRLRSNWREEIWDWEGSGKSVTHKIAGADNIVYPNVQTTKGGGLIDFTHPIWQGNVNPLERAIKNGDYVPMKTEQDAIWFGPNYKKYYPGFKDVKLPKYGDGNIPVTTGGTGMPAPQFYGGISKEARPTADTLERIANFVPYVGTIQDIQEVINGNLAKTPSAVIGAVADVALPGIRASWKGIKAAKTAVQSAPMLIDKIKNYKLLQKLQKKFAANVAYQGIGTYQDVLDDQGYIKSTKKK